MATVDTLLAQMASALKGTLSSLFNNLIVAALILVIGFVLGRVLGKIFGRALHEMDLDKFIHATTGREIALEDILSSLLSYAIYFVTIAMALDRLGLNTFVFNLLAGSVIAIIVLSGLLALRDYIPNIFAGLLIQYRGLLKVGDVIKIDGMEGRVAQLHLSEVRLETKKKDIIYIPNALLLRRELYKKR